VTSSTPRPIFDRYKMPRARHRAPSATAVAVAAHVAVALLVLWRGAVRVEDAWGGTPPPESRGVRRPAITWVALPEFSSSKPEAPPPPPPTVTVPAVARPLAEPVKLDLPASPRLVLVATPTAIATGSGSGADPASEPDTGVRTDTVAGTETGTNAHDIFGPTPSIQPAMPPGAPADEKGEHEVRFWIRADGRVARIEVIPRIRDSAYRRRFMEAMSGFAFDPAKTQDGRPIEYVYSILVHP